MRIDKRIIFPIGIVTMISSSLPPVSTQSVVPENPLQNTEEQVFRSDFDYVGIPKQLFVDSFGKNDLKQYVVITYGDQVTNSKEAMSKHDNKAKENTEFVLVSPREFKQIKQQQVGNKGFWGALFKTVGAGIFLDVTYTGVAHGVNQVYENVSSGRSWHYNVLERTGYGLRRGWCNSWSCD